MERVLDGEVELVLAGVAGQPSAACAHASVRDLFRVHGEALMTGREQVFSLRVGDRYRDWRDFVPFAIGASWDDPVLR